MTAAHKLICSLGTEHTSTAGAPITCLRLHKIALTKVTVCTHKTPGKQVSFNRLLQIAEAGLAAAHDGLTSMLDQLQSAQAEGVNLPEELQVTTWQIAV